MNREKEIYKVTLVGSAVNLLLTIFKFVAGIVGRSSAMTADAVHSLSDLMSDAVVLIFVRIAGKPQDDDHDYGHGKYETLGTIIVGIMLGLAGLWLMAQSAIAIIDHFNGQQLPRPTMLALVAALVSVACKEGLYQYTIRRERTIHSPALVVNAWHHRSDSLTSIAAIIGIAGSMFLGDSWRVLDPIAAIVVSGFVLRSAYTLSKPGLDELLEKSLPTSVKEEITRIVLDTPGVEAMHHLRTRHIGIDIAIECHIKVNPNITLYAAHEISTDVERRLRSKFGPHTHVAIHAEPLTQNKAQD